jgi:hypothetical protein
LKPLSWAKSLTTDLELSSTFLSDDRGCPLDGFFHEMQIIVCAVFGECHPRGGSKGGGGGAPSLKLGKIWFFGIKSWFFTRNTPNNFLSAPPLTWNCEFAPAPSLQMKNPFFIFWKIVGAL